MVRLSALCTGLLYPQETFLVLISVRGWVNTRGHSAAERIMSMKNSNDTIGNRTRNLLTCSAVPQPTAPPRALKMFVKHIIKTLHVSVTIVWPSSGGRLSCLVLLLHLCLFASSSCLFGMWLYVVYVCACLLYLSVGCLVVNSSQPNISYTSTSGTHTHRQHTPPYQINNLTMQTSRDVVTALSTKDGPLKMVKLLWPKYVGF